MVKNKRAIILLLIIYYPIVLDLKPVPKYGLCTHIIKILEFNLLAKACSLFFGDGDE
jgi:hypothetical protein